MKKCKIRDKVISSVISSCLIINVLFVSGSEKFSNRVTAAVQTVTTLSQGYDSKDVGTSTSVDFTNATNMDTDIYGSISNSYFYKESNKYYMVNHEGSKLLIDIYNFEMKKISSKNIDDELSLFGGFYEGKKYNYIVYGKAYSSTDKETYRVVKYDKNFNRIASLSIDGDKTYTYLPFDGGTSSFAERDDTLIFYSSRERMDGHQSNITLRVNEDDMTIADEYNGAARFPVHHSGHIFRSIVKTDTDGSEIYANLTDRTPCCGVSVIKLNKDGYMGTPGISNVIYTNLEGVEYDPYSIINETDAEVDGLVITDNSYIVTGVFYDNVFVGAVDKTTGNISKTMLTNYNEYSEYVTAQESKLVQIDRNTSVVLWQTIIDGVSSVQYAKVDKNGEIKGTIKTLKNMLLSECQPIYDEGTIRWYTIVNGTNTLYSISDLNFKGNFEPLGSKYIDPDKVWNGNTDTSWYKNSKTTFNLSTPEQLAGLAKLVNDGNDMKNKTFVLNNDIYLNEENGNQVFIPIARVSSGVEFSGIFDGAGHTIYRLYRIESDDSTEGGLFGTIGTYGVVKNIVVDQSYIRQNAGAIAAVNNGTIMFCDNKGKIESTTEASYVGGIAGNNYGMIYGCSNKGRVVGNYGVAGGIAGYTSSIKGCVKACYNSGNVACRTFAVGGIVGELNYIGTVEDCYNKGAISGLTTANYRGGIVGENFDGYIVNCFSTINVFKDCKYAHEADPICGYNHSSLNTNLIYDCYSLYNTKYGEIITPEEITSDDFVKKLNSVTDFFETRQKNMWVKGDYLPVTIAQKANELKNFKFYPTACISETEEKISEYHFGYANSEFSSDNERIATVDADGNITYHGGVGTVTITLTIPETEVSSKEVHKFRFTKYGIAFINEYETLNKGKTLQLSVSKNYIKTPVGGISYTSSDTSVVTVTSNGLIKGLSRGAAVITAKCGSYEAECQIYVKDNSSVYINGKCGTNLSYTLSTNGTLTFTGKGEMTSAPWKDYNRIIKKIVFTDSISNIYQYAFLGCTNLKSVSVPSSVKIIEMSAFEDCVLLENATLANGIETIDDYAFKNTGIAGITLPKSTERLGYRAFAKCYSLKEIICESDCDSMYNGFADDSTMKKIERIYGIAGTEASSLANTYKVDFIPLSCKDFTVSERSSGIRLNKYIGSSGSVIVPSEIDGITVTDIKDDCFTGNQKITSVVASDNLSVEFQLKNCKNLKSIKLSNKMTKISDRMFFGCSSLIYVDIPAGVEKIGEYSFYNCKKLRSISIPESVTDLGKYAFYGCDQLKCLIIPARLESFSVFGLVNESFTTIYGNSDVIKRACNDFSFLSNISYFTIPTKKTTLTNNGITVTGYLPTDTTMTASKSNGIYTVKFLNGGKEIEPCGEITVSIPNSEKNKFVVEIYSDDEEQYTASTYASGKYTFTTQAKNFKFTDAIKGDTNGDGTADIADALMISRYDAGLITLDTTQISLMH